MVLLQVGGGGGGGGVTPIGAVSRATCTTGVKTFDRLKI